ncbi:MAG: DUF1566 domain-containing protein [Proteobacteria bacterium]|nr:DUF1566 domain-containing protein [Pseudomonadota bacterium]
MKRTFLAAAIITFIAVVSLSVTAIAGPVPDTGQTQSYTYTFGEDSDYTINPHSYTDIGNGVVRDNVTGLEWQQTTAPGTYTWQQALDYCNSLSLGGKDDWRLPTIKELSTLVDSSIPYTGPTINTTYFPGTAASYYWSSTTYAANTTYAMTVYFNYGYVGNHVKSGSSYVRAVRGGQSNNSFVDNGDGTISDTSTGLMWQKATAPGGTYTWEHALTYCENLTLPAGGYSDWRLPNRNELQSIVDYSRSGPAINTTYFPGTEWSYYWSSTTDAYTGYSAWYVQFDYGYVDYYSKSYNYYVRAVRGGQCGPFGDSDGDGICDDGDASGVVGDNPCRGGNTVFCDDNCRTTANANQADSDNDGIGDACAITTTTTVQPTTTTTTVQPTTTSSSTTSSIIPTTTTTASVIPTTTTSEPSTLIKLADFKCIPSDKKVIIIWETKSEIDNAGFNLYRAETENGEYEQINDSLIPAEGSATQGASYKFVDDDVQNRKTYYYKLEDIDLNGQSTMHGPVSATPRLIFGIMK